LLNNPHTKYIGIDYGKKRTGISISDYEKIISFPLETVETINLLNFLKDLTKKEKIEKIIIGKPLKLNNNIHLIENEIVEFIKSINKSFPNITIHRVDERFTSKISKKILNQLETKKKIRMDKSIIDKISASLILESYLIKTTK
jgi:putative Holliday junction resolvase